MVRLWEEIAPPDTINPIPLTLLIRQDIPNIPRLRVHITTNIHHPLRRKVQQLVQETLVAPLPRRVNDQARLQPRERELAKDILGCAADEVGVLDVVCFGVFARGLDRGFVNVDTPHLLKALTAGDGEEAGAAVGVYEVLGPRGGLGGVGGAFGFFNDGEVEVLADVCSELFGRGLAMWNYPRFG